MNLIKHSFLMATSGLMLISFVSEADPNKDLLETPIIQTTAHFPQPPTKLLPHEIFPPNSKVNIRVSQNSPITSKIRVRISPHPIKNDDQESYLYRLSKAGVKVAGGIAGAVYGSTLSKIALDAIHDSVYKGTGNIWYARSARSGAMETVPSAVETMTAIIGFRAPDMLEQGIKTVVNPTPKNIFRTTLEVFETGVKLATTLAASIYLPASITKFSANLGYYGTLAATGDQKLASAVHVAVRNLMDQTGASNTIAKAIGYTVPSVFSYATTTAVNWWTGSSK